MYADNNLIKDANGIKCRLDEYDRGRLDQLVQRTGQAPAVLVRNAVIEYMDRLGIEYQEEHKRPEFKQRVLAIAVADKVRLMAEQIGVSHSAPPSLKNNNDEGQQTLFAS